MSLSNEDKQLISLLVEFQRFHNSRVAEEIVGLLANKGDFLQAARWLSKIDDISNFSTDFLGNIYKKFPTSFLILGGGGNFLYPLWKNLDPEISVLNPTGFIFSKDSIFPVKTESCEVICLNYLLDNEDNLCHRRILMESKRVLIHGGGFLISSKVHAAEHLIMLAEQEGYFYISDNKALISQRYNFVPRLASTLASSTTVLVSKG